MIFQGAWSSAVSYAAQDVVTYIGSSYVCIFHNTNNPPDGSPSLWTALGTAA